MTIGLTERAPPRCAGANELARMLSLMGQAVKIDDLVDIFQKYDLVSPDARIP